MSAKIARLARRAARRLQERTGNTMTLDVPRIVAARPTLPQRQRATQLRALRRMATSAGDAAAGK